MRKILALILISLMVFGVLIGCAPQEPEPEPQPEPGIENENGETPDDEIEELSAEGVYVGQIDNNFIEIQVNDEPRSFLLTDETRETITNLNENDQIRFTYYENEDDQLVITSIEKVDGEEADDENVKTATGTYVGQIDPTSIEIMVEGEPKVFRNDEKMNDLLQGINDGDEVEVKYVENEQGQLVLQSIERVDMK